MNNITYIKTYNLQKLLNKKDFEEIKEKTNKKIESILKKWFKENLNNTNKKIWDTACRFWYETEFILEKLDENVKIKEEENWEKYDYIREKNSIKKYIDIKSIKLWKWKTLDDIQKYKYKIYLQEKQVREAFLYCIKNNIDIENFYFEFIWYTGEKKELYRCFNKKYNIKHILENYKPKFENPFNTNWSSEKVLNYILEPFKDIIKKL